MKLHEAKILRGSLAGTRLEWFCGAFESPPYPPGSKSGPEYIGCVDMTAPSNAKSIFFIHKGQPPESFDFHKDAYASFEQIAMAQMVVMEWDKLKNGDKITFDPEMEMNIREWGGSIWRGGSVSTIEQVAPGVSHIKLEEGIDRERGRALLYSIKNEEF